MAGRIAPVTPSQTQYLGRARLDSEGRLIDVGEPLASFQMACGGRLDGLLVLPELREIAVKAQAYGLRLSRGFSAVSQHEKVSGWVDVIPDAEYGGCELGFVRWLAEPVALSDEKQEIARVRRELNRALPEFAARLDPRQNVLTAQSDASDLAALVETMAEGAGRPWTDFVTPTGTMHHQPLHWRLLDGMAVEVPGSARAWTAWLEPLGHPEPGSGGFVLTLASDQPPPQPVTDEQFDGPALPSLGEELAPVLRQPINNIIGHAESIHARLAGPLAEIYAGYAGDMVDAGQHLLALIEDISDLEGVESADFTVASERIDLGEAARQACGILGAKAQGRDITLVPPPPGESQWARGEFRRVLQVLINLVGNAIAYSPEESQVWIRLDREGRHATVTVADQGRGLTMAEQARVFDKFERLGRAGDGGSGLGLYIAARLARAMDGKLSVESAPGQGARFTLALPAAD